MLSLSFCQLQLYPEDGVYDLQRGLLYQSNLWKGQLNVWNPADDSHFVVKIDGVVSGKIALPFSLTLIDCVDVNLVIIFRRW